MLRFILRHKVLCIVGLLLAFCVYFAASKWNTWFHNPSEVAYTAPDAPAWILLTLGNDGELSRNVSWMCGEEVRPSVVELTDTLSGDTMRIAAQGELFESRSGKAVHYHAKLNGLHPACHYAYRVVTDGKASEWYDFTTYPSHRDRFSFLYVGDVQDTIGGQSNQMLREALRRNSESEFLLCGGDLTERPAYQYWEETFRDLDSIAQHMPMMNVTGNHDYLKNVICTLERRFPLIFSYFLDSKVDDNMVYTTTYANTQFFFLDSNREFLYLPAQRTWLEEQLKASTAKWKILVIHHPLYSIRGNNLIQKWFFNGLVQEYGVDLVLQGHEHAYARRTMKADSGEMTTPVYTVSHCSPKNYQIEFDDDFDKYGISSRYYQTIDIKGDTMALATYDAYTCSLYDSLEIIKKNTTVVVDHGKDIPENMTYKVNPKSRKSRKYKQRIDAYVKRHPERM